MLRCYRCRVNPTLRLSSPVPFRVASSSCSHDERPPLYPLCIGKVRWGRNVKKPKRQKNLCVSSKQTEFVPFSNTNFSSFMLFLTRMLRVFGWRARGDFNLFCVRPSHRRGGENISGLSPEQKHKMQMVGRRGASERNHGKKMFVPG